MKELPQIKVSTTKRIQFLSEFSEVVVDIRGVLRANKLIFHSTKPFFSDYIRRKGKIGGYSG